MKHTGKPPKKSTNRTPVRASGRPGKPSPGKRTEKPASKLTGKPAKAGGKPAGKRNDRRGSGDVRTEKAVWKTDDRKPGRSNGGKPDQARPRPLSGDKPREDRQRPRFDKPRAEPRLHEKREPRAPREKREPRSSLGPRANMFGLHAVREAWLNPKRYIHALYLSEAAEPIFGPVLELADHRGLERPEPKILGKDEFDRLLGRDVVHQGVALSAAPLEEAFIQDIISIGAAKPRSVILMLDQVTDPHNVGAILRSACAFGADGVVMQRRHAPELDGVLAKTASGAAEHIPVAYETNLSRTLEILAEAGYIAIGLDEHAEKTLGDITIPDKSVLVLGAEGDGMRRLIREHCDVLVTLPTRAPIASLNVSNAAAVALFALISG